MQNYYNQTERVDELIAFIDRHINEPERLYLNIIAESDPDKRELLLGFFKIKQRIGNHPLADYLETKKQEAFQKLFLY